MSEVKLSLDQVDGYPYVQFSGDLTLSSFTALHFTVKGATKFGTVPVVVYFGDDLRISDEVREVKCWRSPNEVPDFALNVVLIVISSKEHLDEIKSLLVPHRLEHAETLQEAIELLHSIIEKPTNS